MQPTKPGNSANANAFEHQRNESLGWWLDRDLYGLTGSERDLDSDYHAAFILPESPVAAGLSHLVLK